MKRLVYKGTQRNALFPARNLLALFAKMEFIVSMNDNKQRVEQRCVG